MENEDIMDKKLKLRLALYNKRKGNLYDALDFDLKCNLIKPSKITSSWRKHLSNPTKKPIEFYIHIPYCISKCTYCNLHSKVGTEEEINCYIDKLISFLTPFKKIFTNTVFRNLYIGGGTPGIVSDHDFDRLLKYIFENFKFESDGGKCCEMSPLTATESKIALLKKYNFHRISIGIQSLDKKVLKLNNRSLQTEEAIRNAIRLSKQIGIECINVDVMVGIAGNTKNNILETIEKVVAMKPQSISFYPLQTTEKYLKDHFHSCRKECDTYGNQLLVETYDDIKQIAEKAGYHVPNLNNNYLIKSSNQCYSFGLLGVKPHKGYVFTEPQVSVFGVGEGANSLINEILDYKTTKLNQHFFNSEFEGGERSKKVEMNEYIIRTLGDELFLSLSSFKEKFKVDLTKEFKSELDNLKQLGVIEITKNKIVLTEKDKKKRFIYLTLFIDDKEFKKIQSRRTKRMHQSML